MNDKLYKQRRNLFIKREAFESRLIKYFERLIIYMDQTGSKLPKDITYKFPVIEIEGVSVVDLYSEHVRHLFSSMKTADRDIIEQLDNILDCLHRQLDEYEDALDELTSTNH